MKKIIFLFLLGWGVGFGQIDLVGDSKYEFTTSGYMGRCSGGCGDIDGLREFNVQYASNNYWSLIWSGRKIEQNIQHNLTYTKYNKIVALYFKKVNRWETLVSCDGGPVNRFNTITNVSDCFNSYQIDAGDGLQYLSVTTRPVASITNNGSQLYLSDEEFLNINLTDNLSNNHYNWKYRVADGGELSIPFNFNNSNILNIKGSDFLSSNDFGKVVTIYLKTDCGNISNTINFTYLKAAPRIVSITSNPTKCFESNDGSVSIKFNRQLEQSYNEVLSLDFEGGALSDVSNLTELPANLTITIPNISEGNYTLKLLGFFGAFSTYSPTTINPSQFSITKPPKLTFDTTFTNVNCFSGQDGTITITATGGTLGSVATDGIDYQFSRNGGANWQPFSNGNVHTITGLLNGNYTIQVKDANNCVAKSANGYEILKDVEIKTVLQAVQLSDPVTGISKIQPTFNGATNGKIVARIKGGTRKSNDNLAYDYVWKKDGNEFNGGIKTTQYTAFTGAPLNNELEITLDKIPAGNYSLTVTDANYENATQKEGCSIIDLPLVLDQPAKIEVTFTKTNPRCNAENQFGNETDNIPPLNPTGITRFRDESHDGKIIATVTGGVQFTGSDNSGKPYKYFWQKKIAGVWTNISNENNILENIGDGEYSFNVQDFNGYRLGTFDNIANIQSAIIDIPNLIVQPTKLELALTKTDVNCGGVNSGTAKAFPQGGVPPYTYKWTDVAQSTTQEITGLSARNYFVSITDANGCIVQGNIDLPQPSGINISYVVTNPKCFDGNNGRIDIEVTGGNPPFEYFWNGNVALGQSNFLPNLTAGSYSVTIKDSKGCEFSESATLINPAKITVDLGANRTLCNGQKHDLDISIIDTNPKYTWTSNNGFTSNLAQVSLTQAGIYRAKITTSLGCIAEDEIEIKTNQVNIESEFFVTSQAYVGEDVILVNTSNPFGQNTEWVYPTDAIVVSQEPKFTVLKFDTPGSKAVSLKQTQGDCFALYSKNINVEDRGNIPNSSNNNTPFIKDFLITPMPVESDGNFKVVINLQEISPIKLRLYSLIGQNAIIQKSEAGAKNYVVDFNLSIASGTYILVLETAKQTLIRKIIKE